MLKNLEFIAAAYKMQFKTLLEYKKSFVISAITMTINDFFMVFFWYVFFNVMPKINGWGFNETILLVGFVASAFGFHVLFFAGVRALNDFIVNGELDFYLLKPKNIILNIAVSKIDFSAFGEFLFGFICLWLSGYLTLANFLLFNLFAFFSGVIFTFTFVLISLPAFFIPKTDILYYNLNNAALHFSTYPTDIFSGAVKYFLVFIVPAFFITTIPVKSIIKFSWESSIVLIAFTIAYTLLIQALFNICLKRYESGNTIALRT